MICHVPRSLDINLIFFNCFKYWCLLEIFQFLEPLLSLKSSAISLVLFRCNENSVNKIIALLEFKSFIKMWANIWSAHIIAPTKYSQPQKTKPKELCLFEVFLVILRISSSHSSSLTIAFAFLGFFLCSGWKYIFSFTHKTNTYNGIIFDETSFNQQNNKVFKRKY